MITLMGRRYQSKTDSYCRGSRERFEEDALRIIRGLRFQSQLNFQIVNETFEAMATQISDIQYLSIERIVVELKINQRNQCF